MSAASEPVMDAVEKVAIALFHTDGSNPDDWPTADADLRQDYRGQARGMIHYFPQLALDGREETQLRHRHHLEQTRPVSVPSDLSFWNFEQRTVWESPWSEVQS